jgi:ribosomal protein S15P/S13E
MEKLKKPSWVKMKEPELKKIIAELAEKNPLSQIGLILRDQYGIPTTKVFGKKLKSYLKELGIEKNEELENAEKKVERIKEHLKKSVTDRKAKHKLQKAQSKLNKTKKYWAKNK